MTLKAINAEKHANSLRFKQRNKQLKELLLDVYGSFEEMALCGVEGWGRSGYVVPLTHGLVSRIVLDSDRNGIESLQLYIEKGLLAREHVYRAFTPEEMAKFKGIFP